MADGDGAHNSDLESDHDSDATLSLSTKDGAAVGDAMAGNCDGKGKGIAKCAWVVSLSYPEIGRPPAWVESLVVAAAKVALSTRRPLTPQSRMP